MNRRTLLIYIGIIFIIVLGSAIAAKSWRYAGRSYNYNYYQSPYGYGSTRFYYPSYGAYNYGATAYPSYYGSTPYYRAYPYYESPLSSKYMYRYGLPSVGPQLESPSYVTARGKIGQLCGKVGDIEYGCDPGLNCDYRQGERGVGVCSRASYYG